MDRRTIVAVILSLAIWIGWQKFYWEPYQKAQRSWQQQQQLAKAQQEGAAGTMSPAAAADTTKLMPAVASGGKGGAIAKAENTGSVPSATKNISLGGPELLLGNGPELIQGWTLPHFKTSEQEEDKRRDIDLEYVTGFSSQMKLGFSDQALSGLANQNFQPLASLPAGAQYADSLSTEKFEILRDVRADATAENTVVVNYSIRFRGEVPGYIFLDLYGNPKRAHDHPGSIFGEFPDKVDISYWNREGAHKEMADALKERKESKSGAYWLGLNTRYFLFAAVPAEGNDVAEKLGVQLQRTTIAEKDTVEGRLVVPTNGQAQVNFPVKVYFGPKRLEALEKVSPTLRYAIDFGWTSAIAIPLLKMLQWVYSFVHNYGVAIIIVTLFVKLLLFPLTYKSQKAMAQLSKLRPQMERLQKKYADDKQKLQQEIWALYKSNGANPLGGCLPLLIQMPIFFALYRVFFNCMELYQAPFAFWIHDLSAKDPYFVAPVILSGLMYLQQRLTPATNADPSQQAVMRIMPVMFGAFMLFLPSGLNIYMLVNTIVSILQQYFLNRKFGVHNVTAVTETAGAVVKST